MNSAFHEKLLDENIEELDIFSMKIKKTFRTSSMVISERLGRYGQNLYNTKRYYMNEEYLKDPFLEDLVQDERIPTQLKDLKKDTLPFFKEYLIRYYYENNLYEK